MFSNFLRAKYSHEPALVDANIHFSRTYLSAQPWEVWLNNNDWGVRIVELIDETHCALCEVEFHAQLSLHK